MQTSHVFDVTEATFEADVLERSRSVPVVVDFWAEWCGPCRTLGPLLERLAAEADGAWVLAKLDVDTNQSLAAAFRIQGIPAVKAFRDGRPVAEFTGALPEPQVRSWLEQLGPSKADLEAAEARRAEEAGDLEGAAEGYRRALSLDAGHAEAKAGLARVELVQRATSDGDEASWRKRLEADPADVDAAKALADIALVGGDAEAAFDTLLTAVEATAGDEREAARAHLVRLLETLEPSDPRAAAARKRLANALF